MSNYTIEVTENVVNLDVLKDHDIVIEIKSSDNFITFDTPSGYPIAYTSGILAVNRIASGYLIENLTSGNTIVRTFSDQNIAGYKTFSNDVITSGNLAIRSQPAFISPSYFPVLLSDPSTFSRNIYTRTSSQIKSDLGLNNVQNVALSGINFSAGSGLIGGGNLSSSRTFDIGQGDGLTVSADSIGVNSTVVRTTGDQTIAGFTTFSGSGIRITTGAIGPYRKDIVFKANVGTLFSNTVTITPTNNLYTDRIYYLPEVGADADFVLTAGSQVITGPKTFTNSLIFNSGSFQSLRVGVTDVSLSGHTHTISNITGLQTALDNKQASGNYALSSHTHTSSNITDFNTSVDSRITNANLQPSGNYSIVGHTHTISNVTGLQTELDNKQASGNYSLVGHTHTSSNITDFNTSVSGLVNGIYAPLNSPSLTGTPLTPTASAGTNSTQIASTAFVRTEISNLVASAPLALDTLNELATALGNDANFSTTVTNNLAGKANLSGATFTGSISGPSGNFTSLKVNNVDVSANGHTHTSSNITDFNTSVDSRITNANLQPSGNYSVAGHTHTSSNITDFNPSVSGLLPVKNISNGNYISLSSTTGNYTISVTGLQPSGNYSVIGHTHTSSNITDFNSSVSGLLPVKNIISGTDIAVSNSSGTYTISSTASGVPQIYSTVFNNTGSPIPKMSVVYINGGQGDMPTVALSIADGESTSSKTYAVTTEAISNMSSGRVVVSGPLTALNTDQFNPTAPQGNVNGTTVWLSPTVSGGLTITKPSAPYHMVAVGTIVRTHQTQGIIEVKIQNGFELHELHNVAINGVTDGQFLQYNSGSGLWLASSSGNFSTLNVNGTGVSISGHTHTSSNITNFNSSVSGLLPVGTANYLSKFGTGGSGLSNSLVFDNGTNVGIGTTAPQELLHVSGTISSSAGNLLRLNNSSATTNPSINFRIGGVGNYDNHFFISRNGTDVFGIDTNNRGLFLNSFYLNGNQSFLSYNNANAAIKLQNTITNDLEISAVSGILFQSQLSTKMRMDQSGNFGIGTTTPSNRLEVAGGDVLIGPSDSTRQLSFFNNSYGIKAQSGLEIFTGDIIRFRKGSTEYARIDANGKVGVGTTTPSGQLHVIGTGLFSNGIGINTNTPSGFFDIKGDMYVRSSGVNGGFGKIYFPATNFGTDNSIWMGLDNNQNLTLLGGGPTLTLSPNGGNVLLRSSSTNIEIGQTYNAGTNNQFIRFVPAGTEAVRITSSGNVGIGTTTPSGQLHVVGDTYIDNSFKLYIVASGASKTRNYIWSPLNGNLEINAGGPRVLLSPDGGTVDIGGTVSQSINIGHGYLNAGANNQHLRFTPGGTELIRITNSGTMGIGLPTTSNLFNQQPYANTRVHIAGSGADSGSAALIVTNSGISPLLYVRNDGNIGIGTTSPSSKLDVNGNVNIDGNLTFDSFTESVVTIGNSSTSQAISLTSGTVQTCTLTGNCTFTMPTATAGKSFTMFLNTGTGNFTATFSGVRWADSATPTATILANKVDIYSFISDGAYWYGSFSQNYG